MSPRAPCTRFTPTRLAPSAASTSCIRRPARRWMMRSPRAFQGPAPTPERTWSSYRPTAGCSSAQARRALHQLDRGLSTRLDELRTKLLELEALLAYEIDFPDEDEGPVAPERVVRAWREARDRIARLLDTASEGERLREGALLVIAGRPNAGKSSLFNALLGTERAIVTEVPGTTRDAVEAHAVLEGFPFRLVDTAGLRESDERIERMGIAISKRYLETADLVLFCRDSDEDQLPDVGETPVVEVVTKA